MRTHALTASAVLLAALATTPALAIGILVPTDPSVTPTVLRSHRVEATVTERGAVTKVTQEFENPSGRPIEATYLFPLPKGATVDEFALWMNGKRETGKVLERGEARRIYESIVRQTRDPGLIEYVDADFFEARVFPVPASGRMKVELIYSHLVPYDGGAHRYIYPMKTNAAATRTLEDFTFTVTVLNKLPIRNLFSPTHTVAARTFDNGGKGSKGVASFEQNAFSLADDFVLTWSVDDADVGITLLSHKTGDDSGYFMLLASPKDGAREKEIIGKRVSFVVDTSGSMMGEKIEATKRALDYCVAHLGEDDLFNVITFGGYVESFSEKMVAASPRNVSAAREFVKKIEPLGGTNIDEALQTAFKSVSGSSKAPHMIVFLTDGRPTIGETDAKKLISMVGTLNTDRARLFSFGVGDDVNTLLLDKLAEEHGGSPYYLDGDARLEGDVKQFWDRVSHPVFSDLTLTVDGVRVFGTHPRKLPDLFRGGQLVVLGRYKEGGKAKITIEGTSPKGRQKMTYDVSFPSTSEEHTFIPRLWAQRQVGALLGEIREKGESKGLVDEVTQLATRFGIVTPYTSYLVVEPGAGTVPGPGRPMPSPIERERRLDDKADLGAFAPAPEATADEMPTDGIGGFGGSMPTKGAGGARGAAPATGRDMLREESGADAVKAAKEIGKLKTSTSSSARKVQTAEMIVSGRTFRFDGVTFVDDSVQKTDKRLVIQAYSAAYFAVLAKRPDLKSALALGESVVVRVGKGRALVLAADGKATVSDAELATFLAK
jgi:Ca-activated chloride channel family protein